MLSALVCFLVVVYEFDVVFRLEYVLVGGDEEVGDDVVALGHVVAQLHMTILLLCFAVVEEVDVPLYHVPCIGKLLVYRLLAKGVASLVILGVADVIDVVVRVVVGQLLVLVEVVHSLAVGLVFQFLWQLLVTGYQLIDDGFKHNMETLHQQVFPLVNVEHDVVWSVEEGIAQFP